MTTKALLQRLERVEARQSPTTCPPYLSVATVEDLPAALEGWPAGCPVKVYVQISPDDWPAVP